MSSSTIDEDLDEYEDFEDFEDDDEEPGFSGLVVLLMGALMLGAMVAVVWVAYSHGVRMGQENEPPIVAADPAPVKVEKPRVSDDEPVRAVYDQATENTKRSVVVADQDADGANALSASSTPTENPLSAVARTDTPAVADPVADRIASLAEEVETTASSAASTVKEVVEDVATATPTVPTVQPASRPTQPPPQASVSNFVVQVAALKSQGEAETAWQSFAKRLGTYADGKSPDIIPPTSA
ncbi:MAG: hypothetical protein AAF742_05095, partial [Pseudomonadota bacterium]